MILKQGHTYRAMPHDGKLIAYIYRGGRCYYIASPYSHEATQALKAAFPAYWTAIRDYGFAHPQLVPFINEDPMLIVSLVEVGKERWLKSDGLAYVNTGIIADNNTYMKMRFRVAEIGNDKIATISYADFSAGNRAFGIGSWDGRYLSNFGKYSFLSKETVVGDMIEYINDKGKITFKYQDGQESLSQSSTFTCPSEMIIPGISRNGSYNPINADGVEVYEYVLQKGDIRKEFIPYLNGMLDISNINEPVYHPNANTQGTFTIEITDKE